MIGIRCKQTLWCGCRCVSVQYTAFVSTSIDSRSDDDDAVMWEKVEPQSINFPIDVFQNNSEPNISCGLIDWVADVLVNAFAEQYLVKALHGPSMLYGHTPAKWLFTIIDVQPVSDLNFFVFMYQPTPRNRIVNSCIPMYCKHDVNCLRAGSFSLNSGLIFKCLALIV